MTPQKLEKLALQLSVVGTLFMAILGISCGLWIHSEAILLDGFFNFISFIISLASLWVSWLITQPANKHFQFDYLNFIPLINVIKGLSIFIISLFALGSSVIAILNGGRSLEAKWAVFYCIIAAFGCLIIALIQHNIGRISSSAIVIVDANNWLINGIISLGVGLGFTLVVFLKGSSLEWFIPYADSTIVILVVLASIGIPIRVIIQGVKELLLGSPSSKLQRQLKEILAEKIQDLPCTQYSLRMTQTGQYIYIYLLWLLPQNQEGTKIQDTDHYRKIVTQGLHEYSQALNLDIIFTEDKDWFNARKISLDK